MKKKIYILCFIITGVLFIAGCGSSGGGDSNQAPVISNLLFSPSSASLGQEGGSVTVTGYVDFVDTDGDLATLRLTSSAGADMTIPITGFDGQTSGTINGGFSVSTESIGTYSFEVWLIDIQGNSSNKLSGTFEVKKGIVDEYITLHVTFTYLKYEHIVINSIIVRDSTGFIYPEAGNYVVSRLDTSTRIRCISGGLLDTRLDCSAGASIIVSYTTE